MDNWNYTWKHTATSDEVIKLNDNQIYQRALIRGSLPTKMEDGIGGEIYV